MTQPKAYICGPMSGYADLNRHAFESAAAKVTARGHLAVIPHDIPVFEHEGQCPPVYGEITVEGVHDGGCYLRSDIAELVMCDYIVRLPGWRKSLGATTETFIAGLLGIRIEDHQDDSDE